MSESTRKKIIFGILIVAIIWGYNNLKSTPKNPAAKSGATPTVDTGTPVQEAPAVPTAPKLVNIEQKAREPWGKDPFRVQHSARYSQRTPEKPKWQLSGILYNSQAPVAIINNKPVKAGDTINSARVLRIDRKSVMLEYNGSKMTLTVTKG
ncbi:MAG: hypothetical protein JSV52_01795 [Candidatus Zixiibacteriota bacterium]|nr:MAG: hypothetical protein JSV52_01795 [candidate division Zixibacteria bacterium]